MVWGKTDQLRNNGDLTLSAISLKNSSEDLFHTRLHVSAQCYHEESSNRQNTPCEVDTLSIINNNSVKIFRASSVEVENTRYMTMP